MRHYLFLISVAIFTCLLGVGMNGLWSTRPHPTITTSEALLLSELLAVEDEWHQAREARDQSTLRRVLADEFINIDEHGEKTDKAGYIEMVMKQRVSGVFHYEQPRVTISMEDGATLEVTKMWRAPGYAGVASRDIDRFVKREGRWQVISSDSASLREVGN